MPDIGVLTFHNNDNRGAILQAYALTEALSSVFDCTAEIVDYRTLSKKYDRTKKLFVTRRPWKIPQRIQDRRIVNRFLSTDASVSRQSIITNDHKKAVDWIERQDYDILVTGSDEVWKIKNGRTDGALSISSDRPFPNLYFLDPSLTAMKVAYAASGNTTDLSTLSPHQVKAFRQHLAAYDAISVRDRHTELLLEELGIDDFYRVPDPTLLGEFPKRDGRSILAKADIDLDRPIVAFHGPDNHPFGEICDQYRERGYQVVTPTSSRFADVEFRGIVGPFEYYALYEHFDMVVTDSLHSTIFSLKSGTPFATLDISDRYADLESKTHSLLHDFSLLDRHIDATDGDISSFYERQDMLEQDLDTTEIDNRIDELRREGFEFLETVKEAYETND